MITLEEAKKLIAKHCFGKTEMDELGFQNLLIDDDNGAYKQEVLKEFHDMTRPLHEYFISTSHNTYLSGGQLNSLSSIEMYINALKMGCRCLEIDIWDGPNSEPIVYHGHTLTSKILFKDIITVIKSHGFKTNPYPIILSFENHCSHEVQEKMAFYVRTILGDMVIPCKDPSKPLPSPIDLRKKVLIKGTSNVSSQYENFEDIEEFELEKEAENFGNTLTKEEREIMCKTLRRGKKVQISQESESEFDETSTKSTSQVAMSMSSSVSEEPASASASRPRRNSKWEKSPRKGKSPRKDKREKICKSLTDLTYMKARKLHDFPNGYDAFESNNMSSFSETRMNKLLASGDVGFQHMRKFNSKFVSRVFPKGTRFDSSNYDPILYWYAGCQMLALNFQTTDSYPMLVNWAKFRENGNCGYLLRPHYLNKITPASGRVEFGNMVAIIERFTRPKSVCDGLKLKIFGARLLPKVANSSVDPVVQVSLYDGSARNVNLRSNLVKDNGFCPDFEFDETISIYDSDNSFLTFTIFSNNNAIAFYCIPINHIRDGYRVVELYDNHYDRINKGMCHLFCHFEKFVDEKIKKSN